MRQQQILFSIVMANYNHGKFLEQAIESVLNQNFSDYELIIIDGGSTDNSVDIIKKYNDKIAYWVSEKDNGQSDAFNKGFAKSTGKFGFWLNADDMLMPNSLSKIEQYIKKYPSCEWFVGNTIFFDKNNTILYCRTGPSWNSFIIKYSDVYVYGPSSIFSIDMMNRVGGFDVASHYCMDIDLWLRFFNAGCHFVRVNSYLWGFRIHDDSKTSHGFMTEADDRYMKDIVYVTKKNNWKYLRSKRIFQIIYKLLCGSYFKSYFDSKKYKGENILNFK